MDDWHEIKQAFLIESGENLQQLERGLLSLEANAGSGVDLAQAFRAMHTVKGACGFLGFATLEALAHQGESVLALLRDGQAKPHRHLIGTLLALVDAAGRILAQVASTGGEGDEDFSELMLALARLQPPTKDESRLRGPHERGVRGSVAKRVGAREDCALGSWPENISASAAASGGDEATRSVWLEVSVLGTLNRQADDLARTSAALLEAATHGSPGAICACCGQVTEISAALCDTVRQVSMQPIESIWKSLPRQVREWAVRCGKRVEVQLEGNQLRLGRSILQSIRDPLLHLVRNAVDHGIEPPATRAACGKPPAGCVLLRASCQESLAVIEVCDDGAGLNADRIRAQAVALGLVEPQAAGALSEAAAIELAFIPGLSTAATITTHSGRGVGLDVVKSRVESLGGSVQICSRQGRGTSVKMRFPLPLAVLVALVIHSFIH